MPVLALIVLGWFGLLERRFWLVLPVILLGLPSALEENEIKESAIRKMMFAHFVSTNLCVCKKEACSPAPSSDGHAKLARKVAIELG